MSLLLPTMSLLLATLFVLTTCSSAALAQGDLPDPPAFKPTCDVASISLFGQPLVGSPVKSVPIVYAITLYNDTYWPPPALAYLKIDLKQPTSAAYYVSINGVADPRVEAYPFDFTDTERLNATALGWDASMDACNSLTVTTFDLRTSPGRMDNCTYVNTVNLCARPSIVGDPQFAGLRGQTFQVHGIDGGIYNLITTTAYQVNSRFVFLSGPRPCPVMPSTGRPSSACWSHAGSYLSNVALLTARNDRVLVETGPAATGFSVVMVNGQRLSVGGSAPFAGGKLKVVSSHEATLHVGPFEIELENVDMFLNMRSVRVRTGAWHELLTTRAHGLLGQTWQHKRYAGRIPEIEGEVDDYLVGGGAGGGDASDDMFATDHVFNRLVVEPRVDAPAAVVDGAAVAAQ